MHLSDMKATVVYLSICKLSQKYLTDTYVAAHVDN